MFITSFQLTNLLSDRISGKARQLFHALSDFTWLLYIYIYIYKIYNIYIYMDIYMDIASVFGHCRPPIFKPRLATPQFSNQVGAAAGYDLDCVRCVISERLDHLWRQVIV